MGGGEKVAQRVDVSEVIDLKPVFKMTQQEVCSCWSLLDLCVTGETLRLPALRAPPGICICPPGGSGPHTRIQPRGCPSGHLAAEPACGHGGPDKRAHTWNFLDQHWVPGWSL